MTFTFQVLAPEETRLEVGFGERLSEILSRAAVPFEIQSSSSPSSCTLVLDGATESEARYVTRLLQRAGYDLKIWESRSG